ncbi:hypothetical protein Q3G72_002402 [Acer saccharum]|nr:hypothetical protein Q3G72_002402 [Acer saccharum]
MGRGRPTGLDSTFRVTRGGLKNFRVDKQVVGESNTQAGMAYEDVGQAGAHTVGMDKEVSGKVGLVGVVNMAVEGNHMAISDVQNSDFQPLNGPVDMGIFSGHLGSGSGSFLRESVLQVDGEVGQGVCSSDGLTDVVVESDFVVGAENFTHVAEVEQVKQKGLGGEYRLEEG